jgi:hypothetical protein
VSAIVLSFQAVQIDESLDVNKTPVRQVLQQLVWCVNDIESFGFDRSQKFSFLTEQSRFQEAIVFDNEIQNEREEEKERRQSR